ncbi:hypothetical protein [Labrys wisconsinensis]|uniref:Uncharacterized protein n=1 Tax=Labrys wisconsinensis TaxID=425677 RepID=A0ABU0JGW9_9HYPH|nr:hypothetical protein [Labrys wisconsinensis]MDQ0473540.1 hypothetical protein [Labrys wisconsinensis]
MSNYEEDLRQQFKDEFDAGHVREVGESIDVFSGLAKLYPTMGSKIDWNRVPRAVERVEGDISLQAMRFVTFFDEMCSRFELSGPVLYVGDSATEFALEGAMDAMRRILGALIEIPQHHYFIGPNYLWCISMTMEGDMAFGFR